MDRDRDRLVFRAFKKKGLTLSADASRAISRVLAGEESAESSLEQILDEIKDRIEKKEITSSVIGEDTVISVVAYLSSSEEDLQQESTQLFDAFNSPKIVYDERTKTYKVDPNPIYKLHGTAESRAQMFRERLLLTQQRLLRSGTFISRTMGQVWWCRIFFFFFFFFFSYFFTMVSVGISSGYRPFEDILLLWSQY